MKKSLLLIAIITAFFSCSVSKKINRLAQKDIFQNNNFVNAHTGISIYDDATGHYLFNYQAEKYFVPASNTKLFSCYAAMKYLGNSITALQYHETNDTLFYNPPGRSYFSAS